MGYRSEVVLAVSKELVPHFMATMARFPEVRPLVFEYTDNLNQDYDGEGGWLIHWSDIKWYNATYEPIGAIQSFVDNCDADTLESWTTEIEEELGRVSNHFRFLRIGEEWDDVENKGEYCWDSIGLNRSMCF